MCGFRDEGYNRLPRRALARQAKCGYLTQHKTAAFELLVKKMDLIAKRREVTGDGQRCRPCAYQSTFFPFGLNGPCGITGSDRPDCPPRRVLIYRSRPALRRCARDDTPVRTAGRKCGPISRETHSSPSDHVCLGVFALGDQADVFGHRRVRRASPLAIHDFVEIFGIFYVGWLQIVTSANR